MIHAIIQLPFQPGAITGYVVRLAFAVTAALVFASAASAVSRHSSAAVRHKVWSLAVTVSLLIPAMLLLVPERRLGLIGSNAAVAESRTSARLDSTDPPIRDIAVSDPTPPNQSQGSAPAEPASISNLAKAESSIPPVALAQANASMWAMWLGIVWSIPALFLIVRLIRGTIASQAIVRRATKLDLAGDEPAVVSRLKGSLSRPDANRMPAILESPAVQSPLCVGWLHSTILLPANWRAWPKDQLDAVLVHELAHVVRRDVLWQAIARFSCALYWPHPLVWHAARRMRIERELACDDWVVRGGASPTRYARWLLDLACELKAARTMERLGVAMAGRNGLQTRVQAALDPARRRMPLSRPASLLLTALAAILLVLTGALSPLKAVQAPPDKPALPEASTNELSAKQTTIEAAPSTQSAASEDQLLRFVMGQVVDQSGKPVAGARVTIPPTSPYPATHSVSADADGKFVLTIEPRKAMRLTLFAESRDGNLQALVTLPRPGQDSKFAVVRINLTPAAEFPITVVDAANRPVAGAKIIAGLAQLQTTSDANGKATLRLPAGQSPNFIMARKEDTGLDYVLFARANAPRVDPSRFAPNYVGPIHFVLNGMRTVTVKVVDDKSRPLAGVRVNPRLLAKAGKGNLTPIAATRDQAIETDAAGIARTQVPADVDKSILFSAELGGYSQSGASSWNPKSPGDQVQVVLLQMPTFHLTVLDPDGKPAGGAQVMMVDDHGARNYGNFSNGAVGTDGTADGMLLPNTYYMFAAMKGQTASDPVLRVVRAGDQVRIDLKLKPAVRVHGMLTAGTPATPLANTTIYIQFDDQDSYRKLPPDQRLPANAAGPRNPQPAVMFNRRTDNQGNFELYLAPATYHFVDLNTMSAGALDGQNFTVPSDRPDIKIDCHFKAPPRVMQ